MERDAARLGEGLWTLSPSSCEWIGGNKGEFHTANSWGWVTACEAGMMKHSADGAETFLDLLPWGPGPHRHRKRAMLQLGSWAGLPRAELHIFLLVRRTTSSSAESSAGEISVEADCKCWARNSQMETGPSSQRPRQGGCRGLQRQKLGSWRFAPTSLRREEMPLWKEKAVTVLVLVPAPQ